MLYAVDRLISQTLQGLKRLMEHRLLSVMDVWEILSMHQKLRQKNTKRYSSSSKQM